MKILKSLVLLISILSSSLTFAQMSNTFFKFKYQIEGEKIVKEIKIAYSKKNYSKVIKLVKQISPLFILRPEENLIIADSYLHQGYPEMAIKFANKVISVKKVSYEACKARLIKLKALLIMEKFKDFNIEFNKFKKSYCIKNFIHEIQFLKYYLNKTTLKEQKNLNKKKLEEFLKEMHKIKFYYYLNSGNLKKAEDEIFYYLNVLGNMREAPTFLFKLAEAYYKTNQKDQAKLLYKLIITQWDGTKEALLSKFRLYQIAYNKILAKELVPEKMIEDLLFYINEIKTRYPKDEIVQDANLLEMKIYNDLKKYEMLRKVTKDFIDKYSKNKFIKKALKLYCKAVSNIFQKDYQIGKFKEIFEIEKKDKKYLKRSKCGYPYYILGSLLLDYNFYNSGAYFFINAYEIGVPAGVQPELILKLSLTAFETGENNLFNELFSYLNLKYKQNLFKSNPFYFYLRCIYEAEKDLKKADQYLNRVLKSSLPDFYKEELLRVLRDKAIIFKDYQRAFEYTKNPYFKAKPEDYVFLLLQVFSENRLFFEKVLKISRKKFPDNPTLKWIEAYYLETTGKVKEADKLWEELKKGTDYENELAKSYEMLKKLVEKSHQLVF